MGESISDSRNGINYNMEMLDNNMVALFVGDSGGLTIPSPWANLSGNTYICAASSLSSALTAIEELDNAT